jgi:general secretion pathway protein G
MCLLQPEHVFAYTNKVDVVKYRIAQFEEALLNFKRDTRRLPKTFEGLKALIVKPEDVIEWRGPYINQPFIPLDSWNNCYIYIFPSQYGQKEYDLYSLGPNGIDEHGHGDDIAMDK